MEGLYINKNRGCNCPVFGVLCLRSLSSPSAAVLSSTTNSGHLKCNENIQAALKTPHVIIMMGFFVLDISASNYLNIPVFSFESTFHRHFGETVFFLGWRTVNLFFETFVNQQINIGYSYPICAPWLHSLSSLPMLLITNSFISTPTCETVKLRLHGSSNFIPVLAHLLFSCEWSWNFCRRQR